jgi:hypothetical protein
MAISSRVKLLAYNILEEGTVAVTGADSGYPAARLYDRSLGFYCVYSTSGAYAVTISANTLAVDTLIVEGHNLNGVACYWEYSDNGSSWTSAVTDWTQSGNTQIVKQMTAAATHTYWRFRTSTVAFQATEVFMGRMVSIPVIWDAQPRFRDVDDIAWYRTYGGVDHSIRVGPKRKNRTYTVFCDRSSYPIATLRSDFVYLDDYVKPLYVIDHEDNCFLAKFDGSLPEEEHLNEGLIITSFSVLELPA